MKQENFVENIPGILLLSHGPFCQALLESAQMIGGEAVNVVALPLLENASIDEYGEKAMQTFKQMPEGSIVLFDLASGTPFNQMMMKSGGEEFPGLCGMNLPVLLEAMTMREAMKGSELVALLEESTKAAVVNIKSFYEPYAGYIISAEGRSVHAQRSCVTICPGSGTDTGFSGRDGAGRCGCPEHLAQRCRSRAQ